MYELSEIISNIDADRLGRYEHRGLRKAVRVKCESNRITIVYPDYDVVISAYGQTRNDRHNFSVTVENGRGPVYGA